MRKIDDSEYHDLVRRWRASGMSKAAFADGAGISRAVFYYWSRKLDGQDAPPVGESSFSLVSPRVLQGDPLLRISYPSGVVLEFFAAVDPDTVRKLL
jgi:hypothetical protein